MKRALLSAVTAFVNAATFAQNTSTVTQNGTGNVATVSQVNLIL